MTSTEAPNEAPCPDLEEQQTDDEGWYDRVIGYCKQAAVCVNCPHRIYGQSQRLLTSKETARYLSVHASKLSAWRRDGTGPPYYRLGKHARYRVADLEEWLQHNWVPYEGNRTAAAVAQNYSEYRAHGIELDDYLEDDFLLEDYQTTATTEEW